MPRSKPVGVKKEAYKQGAVFIINCLKYILNDKEPGKDKNGYLLSIKDRNTDKAKMYMKELIVKLSKGGKKPRILFHVDEHRKMCERTGEKNDPGADFSRGAMSTLAMAIDENSDSSQIDYGCL